MLCSCKICGSDFGTFAALASHTKWKHGPRRRHECPVCHVAFRDSFGVKRHVQSVHSASHVERSTSCPLCDHSAPKKSMKSHFQIFHDIDLIEETLTFNSLDDFMSWKRSMESDTRSKYVKHRASKKQKDGTILTYFYCYRDGQFKSHSKGLRPLKKIGSIKMNAYCPASLKVEESDSHVIVLFRKTHVGHSDLDKGNSKVKVQELHNFEEVSDNCTFDDFHVGHNDEVSTTVEEDESQIEKYPDDAGNVTVVIEVPNSSEETLLKKKQEELEKLIEVLNSIKTDDGLEAFKKHVAPLQSIVLEADNKWPNVISVTVLEDNDVQEETSETSFCREEEELMQTVKIFNSDSLEIPLRIEEIF